MRNQNLRQNRLKVVILGEENVGKTTLVRQLNPDAKSVEHTGKDGLSITVGCDIGKINLDGHQVHVFGTPGHTRFAFARRIVTTGAHFGILLIDSERLTKDGMSDREKIMEQELIEGDIPYLVCINKMNTSSLSRDEIQHLFSMPVHFISAETAEGIDTLKASLTRLIVQYKTNNALVTPLALAAD